MNWDRVLILAVVALVLLVASLVLALTGHWSWAYWVVVVAFWCQATQCRS